MRFEVNVLFLLSITNLVIFLLDPDSFHHLFSFICRHSLKMLFYSLFKTLINEKVVVELKSNLVISGTIRAVDQYLNIQLVDVQVAEANIEVNPSLMILGDCFIRGSMIRYVQLPPESVDKDLLQLSTRIEADAVARGDSSSSSDDDEAKEDSDSPESPN